MNDATTSGRPTVDSLLLAVGRRVVSLRKDWRAMTVSLDQADIIAKIHDDGAWSARFAFMTMMSAGIAIIGLLQNSVAVIIGAMLIAPLMGPILALGFAVATADYKWMKQCVLTLLGGVALALVLIMVIAKLSPIELVTPEIAARTQPTLFDLAVALLSALAGAYAIIRGREGTIIGVAIATALMPPLGVVGFGLATGRWDVFGGALLLFFTNFMTIALAAAIMARIYGFSSSLSPEQSRWQTMAITLAFILLALPLGYSLRQIAWQASAQAQANSAIINAFGNGARVTNLVIDFDTDPIAVGATVLSARHRADAERRVQARLEQLWGVDAEVRLEEVRVGASSRIDESEAARARMAQQLQSRETTNREISSQLALLAGVDADQVTVDVAKRRAVVRTSPLPDAGLATYRALESRLAAQHSDWMVELVPPLLPLPTLGMDGETISEPSQGDYALALWAARRTGARVVVRGANAAALVQQLRADGANAAAAAGSGALRLEWGVDTAP